MDNRLVTLPRCDVLHDTDQAAEALGVPAAVIRKWRHLGKVMPAGVMPAAVPGGLKPMWKLCELEDLAARYRASPRRKRAPMAGS